MPIQCSLCEYEVEFDHDYHNWRSTKEQPLTIYPVFPGGKPKKEPKGFICAECLHDAKRSRSYMKTVVSGIVITVHVLDRYIERCKADHLDRETAKVAVAKEFSHAKKIRIKKKWLNRRFFNNNRKPANYYFDGGFIYITTKDEIPITLVTIEPVGNKELGRDFWYEDEQET
ncbi:MAG: hypothetical protein H8E17_00420 [Deltaproteobacteria bacterium]|nr:hypothetical protein [Deltaproteobacteria bacterium]